MVGALKIGDTKKLWKNAFSDSAESNSKKPASSGRRFDCSLDAQCIFCSLAIQNEKGYHTHWSTKSPELLHQL